MNKKLKNAIKKAENKQNEADLALQSIWGHLAFSGFRDNEPNLSMASGNEIILEWNGDMEVAMNFIKEAYPFNEETESFIRKKFDMPMPDESKE